MELPLNEAALSILVMLCSTEAESGAEGLHVWVTPQSLKRRQQMLT